MSRTNKKQPPKWWRKESKPNRKTHYRSYRKQTKQQLRQGSEDFEDYKRTCGRLTH